MTVRASAPAAGADATVSSLALFPIKGENMRKIMAIAALALLAAALPAPAGEIKVGYVVKALNSEFWMAVKAGAEAAARENPGVELTILAPDSEINVQQQIQIVEDILIQGIDVLVISPCGAKELSPVMRQAHDSGVPVVVSDTDADFPEKVTFVGTNNIVGGGLAGDYIVKRLGGQGKVAIIAGIMGHQTAMDRVKGAQEAFDAAPGIKVVAMQPANWERALGMTVMENILSTHPDLDAVFCCNDVMAMGAYEAILADRANAFIVGFDANDEALRSIKAGGIAATVAQNAFNIGKFSVEAAIQKAKGQEVPKRIDTGTELVSTENVDKYLK